MRNVRNILKNTAASLLLVGMLGSLCQAGVPQEVVQVSTLRKSTSVLSSSLATTMALISPLLYQGADLWFTNRVTAQIAAETGKDAEDIDNSVIEARIPKKSMLAGICVGVVGLQAFSSYIKTPRLKNVADIKPSKKVTTSKILKAIVPGLIVLGGTYILNDGYRKPIINEIINKNFVGACSKVLPPVAMLVGGLALVTCLANAFCNAGVNDNILKTLCLWDKVKKELDIKNEYLDVLSQKVIKGIKLSSMELHNVRFELRKIGFDETISGILAN